MSDLGHVKMVYQLNGHGKSLDKIIIKVSVPAYYSLFWQIFQIICLM